MKTLLAALLVLSSSALANHDGPENTYKGPPLDKCKPGKRIDTDAVVLRDVDGDTVDVKTKTGSFSIRMLGIDTPETHFMGHSQGEWGERAAEQLARLAPVGSRVKLDLADEPCDKYGRVLAHVFVGKVHVNAEMVKNGMAVNYCMAPNFDYCDDFSRYVQNAIDNREGMFSERNFELPYDFRRRIENAPQRYFVGSIRTKEVHQRGMEDQTPIAERVFFRSEDEIKPPYRLVD